MLLSELWRCIDLVKTDVSEVRIDSIFRVEKSATAEQREQVASSSSLADFSTLKIEAIRSSETSVCTRSTWRHIPEDGILHRCKNLKLHITLHFALIILKLVTCSKSP
jgi:hypothetical protein